MNKSMQGPLAKSDNSPPEPLIYIPPTDNGLSIIYNDDDLIVLSKPSGLLSVPGKSTDHHDSMEMRAKLRFPKARLIHRLDRGTSGVFVMALNPKSQRHLGLQFEKRKTQKYYTAMVSGSVKENAGVIEMPLRTDWYCRPKQMVDFCLGRDAVTHWKVMERNNRQTRVSLNPVTGRSHQLRVHMQAIGHPILGDTFYARSADIKAAKRLMLHAEILELAHPSTGNRLRLHDPCPF
ncbi:MAG: RluA family pseudouridine synthase [Pseudomonadota bacterium]